MLIYGRTQPLAQYTVLNALDALKRLGFDGVEVCFEAEDMRPDLIDEAMGEAVQQRLADLGFTSYSVGYHKDYTYDDAEYERTLRAIELTPSFGTDIFVFSGAKRRTSDQAEWNLTVERTREFVKVAEANGVILAQEFEPDFIVGTTADLLRLFEEIPSPNLAANLDLGHVFLCDPDPMQAIHDVGTKMVHGHVENMLAGIHNHRMPDDGDIDMGQYIQAVHDIGFTGGIALDLYNEDYEQVSPHAIAYLRGLIAQASS